MWRYETFSKLDIRSYFGKRRAICENCYAPFADTDEEDSRFETPAVVAADNVNV